MNTLKCSKCVGTLHPVSYEDIHIYRCDTCSGLLCTPEMLNAMERTYLSEAALDTGDPSIGRKMNAIGNFSCPNCGTCMDPTYDPEQVHIWYEVCPNCSHIWLDAGEFTDLKYKTLMDKLRSMLRGKRPQATAGSSSS
ncbi:MAG: zf-TFIIB domain-containing protein [Pseudomonadota bacterium]